MNGETTWIRPGVNPFSARAIAERNGDEGDWCSACHLYCPKGTARPYLDDRHLPDHYRAKACPRCIERMLREVEERDDE